MDCPTPCPICGEIVELDEMMPFGKRDELCCSQCQCKECGGDGDCVMCYGEGRCGECGRECLICKGDTVCQACNGVGARKDQE